MRYRIQVARTQVAERVVAALDEDEALAKVRDELDRSFGFMGRWETTAEEIASVEPLPRDITPGLTGGAPDGGPLLMSVVDAAKHVGVSRGAMYELVNSGEIEVVRLGRRILISRDAIARFIEAHSQAGR